jgi:hypothetical protein
VQDIRDAMGDEAANRVLSALLRARAGKVRTVTEDEVEHARSYFTEDGGHDRVQTLATGKVLIKWVAETAAAKKAFMLYSAALLRSGKKKPQPKRRKGS